MSDNKIGLLLIKNIKLMAAIKTLIEISNPEISILSCTSFKSLTKKKLDDWKGIEIDFLITNIEELKQEHPQIINFKEINQIIPKIRKL